MFILTEKISHETLNLAIHIAYGSHYMRFQAATFINHKPNKNFLNTSFFSPGLLHLAAMNIYLAGEMLTNSHEHHNSWHLPINQYGHNASKAPQNVRVIKYFLGAIRMKPN